jgi:hypothetical protein
MSLIVSWVSIDTLGVISAYIASESRISWPMDKQPVDRFDSCRKTFFIKNYPDIFAYCGDVLFPSTLLSTITEAIVNGMIFRENDKAVERFKKFKKILFNEFYKYPKNQVRDSFELLYINKDNGCGPNINFHAYSIKWSQSRGFQS